MNVAFSGTSCTTGLTVGEILEDNDAWGVARGCAEEAIAVAKASGVKLDVGDPIEHIRKLGGKIPGARPSMLLDYNAGRRCEVDAINGAIPLARPATSACRRRSMIRLSASSRRRASAAFISAGVIAATTALTSSGRGRVSIKTQHGAGQFRKPCLMLLERASLA